MRAVCVVLAIALPLPLAAGPKGDTAPAPPASFLLRDRHGHATPVRTKGTVSGGGGVDVQQPTPDVVVVTLTGAVAAADHPCHDTSSVMAFDLDQCFDVVFDKPNVKAATLTVEGRVTGLLCGGRKGSAAEAGGCATVACGGVGLVTLALPDHAVGGGESLSINDHSGPESVPVGPGHYAFAARWQIAASHDKALLSKAASAEFAPEPAVDPLWVGGPSDPFRGVVKKDFGLQIILRLAIDAPTADAH